MLLALLFGSIGLGYFIYGRKQSQVVVKYCGILLMFYPYFVSNTYLLIATGVVLMFLPKFIRI